MGVVLTLILSPQAEANMTKYGKVLLGELPDDTTRLLQALCTDWVPRGKGGGQEEGEEGGGREGVRTSVREH